MFDIPPAEPLAEIGIHHVQYEDGLSADTGEILRLGLQFDNNLAVYLFGGKDDQETRIKGQGVAQNNATSYGVGFGYKIKDFRFFMEGGWVKNDDSPYGDSTEEMIRTQLWTDHAFDGRYRPGAWPTNNSVNSVAWRYEDIPNLSTEFAYELEDGFLYRLGMSWEVINHVSLSASYRVSTAKQVIQMWDTGEGILPPGENCHCLWEDRTDVDFNGFEFGLLINW